MERYVPFVMAVHVASSVHHSPNIWGDSPTLDYVTLAGKFISPLHTQGDAALALGWVT